MIKRFIPIFLGFSLMFGLGVNSSTNNIHKEVIETKATEETLTKTYDLTSSIPTGLTASISLSKDGSNRGMGAYKQDFTLTTSESFTKVTKITIVASSNSTGGSLTATIGGNTFGSSQSVSNSNNSTYTISNSTPASGKIVISVGKSGKSLWVKTINVYTQVSTDPSVALSSDSSSTLNIFKGDTGNVKFLVKNIADVTKDSWSFTFSEGQDNISLEGSTLDTNNVGTVSITASTIGTSKFTVSVDGTSCETVITVNVVAKPASMTIESKTIKEGNILEIATGDSKTVSFSGKDTDGNDYAIKAADVTAEVTSGSSYISLGGTTIIYGNKIGGGVVTFTLNALESVTAKLTVNVFDDYALSVKNISFADNLESEANENPVEAIFSERSASTYFGNTQDIPLSCFTFSYDEDGREDAKTMDEFIYDISKGSNQTIYVFCSLDLENVYSYSITIKDKPISGLLVDGKEVENESAIELDIQRKTTKQLNVSVTPDTTTLDKTIEYVLDKSSDERITVSETGLITVGNILGETVGMITARSKADPSIYVEFYINAVLEDMTVTVDLGEEKWESVTSISVGDNIVFAGVKTVNKIDVTYAMGTYLSGNNVSNAGTLTISNGAVSDNSEVKSEMIYTVEEGSITGTFAFKDSAGKYIYAASGDDNYMKSQNKIDNNASFKITETNGSLSIVAQGSNTRNILQFNAATNPPIFSCYKANQAGIQIYKKSGGTSTITVGADLITAIEDFNSEENFQCDPSGVTFNSSAWANNNMFTEEIKTTYKLANVEANQNGNEVEQFLYNYDHVLNKKNNGIAAYQEAVDFLSRFSEGGINYVSSNSQSKIVKSHNDNNVLVIVTVVSVLGATSIGGYLFLRKRRYN